MNISREIKKAEAIKRMKALGIIPDAINQFKREDIIMVSEPPFGGLYWLNDEEKKIVADFERRHNALVYLVVRALTTIGKMDSLLFVSDYEEEFEMDNQDIKDSCVMTYTINHDMPDCSEFGTIGFKRIAGSIIRTA